MILTLCDSKIEYIDSVITSFHKLTCLWFQNDIIHSKMAKTHLSAMNSGMQEM